MAVHKESGAQFSISDSATEKTGSPTGLQTDDFVIAIEFTSHHQIQEYRDK